MEEAPPRAQLVQVLASSWPLDLCALRRLALLALLDR